jgi:hypothetical protein
MGERGDSGKRRRAGSGGAGSADKKAGTGRKRIRTESLTARDSPFVHG